MALAGVLGLAIGSFLNVVAYRVPAGVSLLRESRCMSCESKVPPSLNIPVLGWVLLRGRCATCGRPISARYPMVEALAGLAFAAVTFWLVVPVAGAPGSSRGVPIAVGTTEAFGVAAIAAAYLYLASISIVLTIIDLDTHRLPNVIVLPSYIVAAALLAAGSALTGDWVALLRGALVMTGLYIFYWVLRLIRPDGMGGGDVKLAGVLGLYLGYAGWGASIVGAFAAFFLGGVFGVALMLVKRADRRSAIPFGPWMILGTWMGLLFGEPLARWYVELFIVT
ncbi:prepilin peptidase [Microbacterium sp. ARD31]|uniref:prepilin peptidase n=1 Tax=Microbacterium sp. ARD31 TaxID=2962576 RepID=UPI00288B133D|nr:prepilin peptidase [Microbacterium sp. ARD31]